MPRVTLTPTAQRDLDALPLTIRARMPHVFDRLAQWPSVSGCTRLRGERSECCRLRTGAYRVVFRPSASEVTIERIRHRKDVY